MTGIFIAEDGVTDEVKKIANHVTDINVNNGVAKAIYQVLDKNKQ